MNKSACNSLSILYLGAFAPPDNPEHDNPAVSAAGNLFQLNFLDAIADSRLPDPSVHAYFPVPSFPKHRRLWVGGRTEQLANGLVVRRLPHINWGAVKILTLGLTSAWAVMRWGRKNRHAGERVVITFNLTAPPAWPVMHVCRWLKIHLVPFIGDICVPGDTVQGTFLKGVEFKRQIQVIPRAAGLLVCNKAIVEDFAPSHHYLLIEGGVTEQFIERFENVAQRDRSTFNVVFAGWLSKLNGVLMLLEAMRLLDMPDLRLTVVGTGEFADDVRKAASNDARISYLGLVPHESVLQLYEGADLLLNIRRTHYRTHRYVFPSKVIECLATGRPLLSTRTGHVEAEFGEFVFILEEETPEELARCIAEIAQMDPQERSRRGAMGRDYVREHKTWRSHVARLERYLNESVLAEGGSKVR